MKNLDLVVPLLGRILLSAIFLMSGVAKLLNWGPTAERIGERGILAPHLFLLIAVFLELAGGLSVLVGYKARWGAFALLLFLIPVTLIMHDFWNLAAEERQREMIQFVKNLAIIGGLLYVLSFGAGPLSADHPHATRREPTPI